MPVLRQLATSSAGPDVVPGSMSGHIGKATHDLEWVVDGQIVEIRPKRYVVLVSRDPGPFNRLDPLGPGSVIICRDDIRSLVPSWDDNESPAYARASV